MSYGVYSVYIVITLLGFPYLFFLPNAKFNAEDATMTDWHVQERGGGYSGFQVTGVIEGFFGV